MKGIYEEFSGENRIGEQIWLRTKLPQFVEEFRQQRPALTTKPGDTLFVLEFLTWKAMNLMKSNLARALNPKNWSIQNLVDARLLFENLQTAYQDLVDYGNLSQVDQAQMKQIFKQYWQVRKQFATQIDLSESEFVKKQVVTKVDGQLVAPQIQTIPEPDPQARPEVVDSTKDLLKLFSPVTSWGGRICRAEDSLIEITQNSEIATEAVDELRLRLRLLNEGREKALKSGENISLLTFARHEQVKQKLVSAISVTEKGLTKKAAEKTPKALRIKTDNPIEKLRILIDQVQFYLGKGPAEMQDPKNWDLSVLADVKTRVHELQNIAFGGVLEKYPNDLLKLSMDVRKQLYAKIQISEEEICRRNWENEKVDPMVEQETKEGVAKYGLSYLKQQEERKKDLIWGVEAGASNASNYLNGLALSPNGAEFHQIQYMEGYLMHPLQKGAKIPPAVMKCFWDMRNSMQVKLNVEETHRILKAKGKSPEECRKICQEVFIKELEQIPVNPWQANCLKKLKAGEMVDFTTKLLDVKDRDPKKYGHYRDDCYEFYRNQENLALGEGRMLGGDVWAIEKILKEREKQNTASVQETGGREM